MRGVLGRVGPGGSLCLTCADFFENTPPPRFFPPDIKKAWGQGVRVPNVIFQAVHGGDGFLLYFSFLLQFAGFSSPHSRIVFSLKQEPSKMGFKKYLIRFWPSLSTEQFSKSEQPNGHHFFETTIFELEGKYL